MNYTKLSKNKTMLVNLLLIRGVNRLQIFGARTQQHSLREIMDVLLNPAEVNILVLNLALDQLKFFVNFLQARLLFGRSSRVGSY